MYNRLLFTSVYLFLWPLAEIEADIREVEADIMRLLAQVTSGGLEEEA